MSQLVFLALILFGQSFNTGPIRYLNVPAVNSEHVCLTSLEDTH